MSKTNITPSRRAVRRANAEHYLLLTLLGFAGSVIITRVFLELTGYPQVGNRELHIAHLLWGGLLLFAGMLVLLILANRSALDVAAVLGGVGVGLFIDEVGKFITQSNDYFYPPAAPIIYAFFLVTVMIYLQVARRRARDPRSELYETFDDLHRVLDQDLSEDERAELDERLARIAQQQSRPDLARLAQTLIAYLDSGALQLMPKHPSFWLRLRARLDAFETRWVSRRLFKAILIVVLLAVTLFTINDSLDTLRTIFTPGADQQEYLASLIENQVVTNANEMTWFVIMVVLEAIAALPPLLGAILWLAGNEKRGAHVVILGFLISLTIVNLLVFYFDQFTSISDTLVQLVLLFAVRHYQHHYLSEAPPLG